MTTLLTALQHRHAARSSQASASMADWLAAGVVLPRGGGATDYDPDITPYWRYWQDIAQARITGRPLDYDPHAHLVEQIWITSGNQLGKTFGYLAAVLAWASVIHPRAMGLVYPRNDDVRRNRDTRLRPMFERSPALRALLPPGQAELEKKLGTKIWRLRTCDLHWLVGNASLDLRTLDLPLVFLDEHDLLALCVEDEGDPIELLLDRQKTYPMTRLAIGVTTPTTVTGHGWSRYCTGSMQRLLIACAGCGAHHPLDPQHLRPLDPGLPPAEIDLLDLAAWHCPTCQHPHRTPDLRQAIAHACMAPWWTAAGGWAPGRWTADDSARGGHWLPLAQRQANGQLADVHPPTGIIRSGQLNSLYSPFISAGRYLAHLLGAQAKNAEAIQTHVNGWDGEPWTTHGDSLDQETIEQTKAPAADPYTLGTCPLTPWRLVISCDQQGNTVERSTFPFVVRAWHADGTSHLVDAGTVDGFAGLEVLEQRSWPCGGDTRSANILSVDTANGNMLRHLRRWCAQAPRRRVSLGGSGTMSPDTPWAELRRSNRNAHRLQGLPVAFYFNAHLFRDSLAEAMRTDRWRIPTDAPDWYMASLGSEERVSLPVTRRGRRSIDTFWRPKEWTDENGQLHTRRDNHWWDAEVMQLALVAVLGWYSKRKK